MQVKVQYDEMELHASRNNYNNAPEEQYMMQDYHPLDHDDEGWCADTDYNIAPWLIPARNNALIAADTSLYPVQPLPYRPNVFNTAPMNTTDEQIRQMQCLSDGPSVMKEEEVRKISEEQNRCWVFNRQSGV